MVVNYYFVEISHCFYQFVGNYILKFVGGLKRSEI